MSHPPRPPVLVQFDPKRRCAELRLCRPETANLLDQGVIAALTNALRELAGQAGLRAIVLSAEGDTFCAGIDLRWMRPARTPRRPIICAQRRRWLACSRRSTTRRSPPSPRSRAMR